MQRRVRRVFLGFLALGVVFSAIGCSGDDTSPTWWAQSPAEDATPEADATDASEEADVSADVPDDETVAEAEAAADVQQEESAPPAPCPDDMALVGTVCMDLYEAPNRAGELPLVMYTLLQGDAWCSARGKRLCYDDDWETACAGPDVTSYPYGDTHDPVACNDDKTWKTYDQSLLNGWPGSVSASGVESLQELIDAARAVSVTAKAAADHVEWLYQATPAGAKAACVNAYGVFDLCGNVEEWTLRRDGGTTDFHGNLKGRYWAEPRTCQGNVTVHGDGFRFYEIGFRCCTDPQ